MHYKMDKKPHRRWIVLCASSYAFIAFSFSLQSIPPLTGQIMQEFNLSNSQVGLLMSIVMIPGMILAIPAGILIDRHGLRLIGSMSAVLAALGSLVTAMAGSFDMALVGRFILGIGGAFITTVTPAIIPQWFAREELGRATGIYGIGMPLATVAAFPLSSMLMLTYGWRHSIYLSTAIGISNIISFTLLVKEGPLKHARGEGSGVRLALTNVEVWKVGIVWLFFNAASLSFTTWSPHILQDIGMDPILASFLASTIMLAGIPFVPVIGLISDKTMKRKPLMVIGCTVMTGTFLLLTHASGNALVASIIILGIAASMTPPVVMALPPEILGPSLAAVGFGVVSICLNIGIAIGPPFVGLLLDMTGSTSLSFMAMGFLTAIGAIVAYSLRTDH